MYEVLRPACLLNSACLISLSYSCVHNLCPLLFFFLRSLLFSQLCTDFACYIAGVRKRAVAIAYAAVSRIANEITLQSASAKERLHLNIIIYRVSNASLQQLMFFLAVHAHLDGINSNNATVLLAALKPVKQLPKLLNQQSRQTRQGYLL
jgi:hypothetical protein